MKSYNLFNWFKKSSSGRDIVLYCNAPECGEPISEERMEYNSQDGEIYHFGHCRRKASLLKVMKSDEEDNRIYRKIGRKEAKELFRQGRLSQSKGLEKRTD